MVSLSDREQLNLLRKLDNPSLEENEKLLIMDAVKGNPQSIESIKPLSGGDLLYKNIQ